MNKTALKLMHEFLEMSSNEFSNHRCNDFELPNTKENREFIEAAEKWNSPKQFEEDGLNISEDGKTIYTMDWFIMDYLAHLAIEELTE